MRKVNIMKKQYIVYLLYCVSLYGEVPADIKKGEIVKKSIPLSETLVIRFADPMGILQNSDQWKDISVQAQQEIDRRTKEVNKLENEYVKKAEELQSMGTMAKPEVKESKREALMTLQSEIQIKTKTLQEYAEDASRRAQMEIFKEVEQTTAEIAQQASYDIVLASGVLYVAPKLDITQDVAQRMNAKYTERKKRQAKPLVAAEGKAKQDNNSEQ